MAVYRLKHRDKWIARLVGANGRAISKTFDRKADAARWHAEQLGARERGEWVDPRAGRMTLAEFYADWSPRQVWERGTELAVELAVRTCTFSDIPLARVRRSHVETWIKTMTANLAASTIKTRHSNVRIVLRAAVRDRIITSDPSEGVPLPRQRRREAAMALPTVEQVRALLEAATDDFRPFVALCAFAGLRLGEAAGLQRNDVDFLRKRLQVSRQVQRGQGGGVEIRAPKWGSERSVYLPDELLMMLGQHFECCGPVWLFRGQGDDPPHQNSVGYRWRRTCRQAGVTGLRLHDLRHFTASGLIAAGCDVVQVQRALGHASAAMTLRVYSHLWPSSEDRTRQAASSLMASVSATDRQQDHPSGL
jgi:integrase